MFGILISIAIKNQTHLSIFESILNIHVSKLYSISELLKEIILMDLFFGLFLVFFRMVIYKNNIKEFFMFGCQIN